jgi:hypothetical protein
MIVGVCWYILVFIAYLQFLLMFGCADMYLYSFLSNPVCVFWPGSSLNITKAIISFLQKKEMVQSVLSTIRLQLAKSSFISWAPVISVH